MAKACPRRIPGMPMFFRRPAWAQQRADKKPIGERECSALDSGWRKLVIVALRSSNLALEEFASC